MKIKPIEIGQVYIENLGVGKPSPQWEICKVQSGEYVEYGESKTSARFYMAQHRMEGLIRAKVFMLKPDDAENENGFKFERAALLLEIRELEDRLRKTEQEIYRLQQMEKRIKSYFEKVLCLSSPL